MRTATNEAPPAPVGGTEAGVHARRVQVRSHALHNPSKVDRVPSHPGIGLTARRWSRLQARPAVAPTSSAEGTMKAGAGRGDMFYAARTRTLRGTCNDLTTSILPLGEQKGPDLRARIRQLSCSKDRPCNIVFSADWAKNAHTVICSGDLFCISTADEAVHVLAPLVAKGPRAARRARRSSYYRARSASARGPTFTRRWCGIKRLRGYAAGQRPCQFVHSYNLERSILRRLR